MGASQCGTIHAIGRHPGYSPFRAPGKRLRMHRKRSFIAAVSCFVLAGFGYVAAQDSSHRSANRAAQGETKEYVPAYYAEPPSEPLPATMDPRQFLDPETEKVYALAAKIKAVLYQQPCYCRCDIYDGHKSLLDCFVGKHGSMCSICKKEAVYAYTQSQKGKTAEQIRKGIMNGEWRDVDLSIYRTSPPSK